MARPLSDEARRAMLDGVRQVVATDGIHACTIDEVVRRTGVAKTTIYRHFGGLDALVLAAVDGMVKAAEPPDTGTLAGDLREIMRRYLDIAHHPRSRELYGWMMKRSMEDPQFASAFRAVRVQSTGSTVVALQRAIARGEVPATIDIPLALHLVQGPFATKRIVEDDPVSEAEFDQLLRWIVGGLTAGDKEAPR